MSSPWNEPDAALRREIRAVRGDLDQLTGYDLPALTEDLTGEITEVRHEMEALRGQVEETEQWQSDHQDAIEELTAHLVRMKTSVDWIERHIRASGNVEVVDLDAVDKELRAAAERAEAGKTARGRWLSDPDRRVRTGWIETHDVAVTDVQVNGRKIVAACADLAGLDWDDSSHRNVRARYRAGRTGWRNARARVAQWEEPAQRARRELSKDDMRRAGDAGTVDAGDRAWTLLTTRLRTTIAQACADGKLLPVWLATPLGPMPPAGKTERWLEVATDLLTYRITYGVTDPVLALGQTPADAGPRRGPWAAKLRRDIQELAPVPL